MKKSPIAILNIVLGALGAVGLCVVAACVDPTSPLPKGTAFYAGLFSGICTTLKAALTQAVGDSDETQGIAPAQVAMANAVHEQAKTAPTVVTNPVTGVTTLTPATAQITSKV